MKCLNKSLPEIKSLIDHFKSETLVAKAVDTLDKIPSIEEVNDFVKLETVVKTKLKETEVSIPVSNNEITSQTISDKALTSFKTYKRYMILSDWLSATQKDIKGFEGDSDRRYKRISEAFRGDETYLKSIPEEIKKLAKEFFRTTIDRETGTSLYTAPDSWENEKENKALYPRTGTILDFFDSDFAYFPIGEYQEEVAKEAYKVGINLSNLEEFLKINTFTSNVVQVPTQKSSFSLDFEEGSYDWKDVSFAIPSDPSPGVTEAINHLQNRRSKVKANIAAATDNVKKILLTDRLKEIEESLEKLKNDADEEVVLDIAKEELAKIEMLLNYTNASDADLADANKSIDFWSDIKEILFSPLTPSSEKMASVLTKAKDLKGIILERTKSLLISDANSKGFELKSKDLEALTSDGTRKNYSLSLGNNSNKFLQYVDSIMTTQARNRDESISRKIREFEELRKGLSKEDIDSLFQKDKDGEYTGGLVTKFSQVWYDRLKEEGKELKSKLNKATTAKEKAIAYKKFHKFNTDNKSFVNPFAFFAKDNQGNLLASQTERDSELAFITKRLGAEGARELLERAERLYDKYLTDLDAFKDYLDAQVSLGAITQEEAENRATAWVGDNSPIIYYQKIYQGLDTDFRGSYLYVASAPNKYSSNGSETAWYDSSYDNIQRTAQLKALYDFIKGTTSELFDVLPEDVTSGLQSNFLFQVSNSFTDKFLSKGLRGIGKHMKSKFINAITDVDEPTVSKKERDTTGRPEKSIPIKFVNEIEDSTERTRDIDVIMYSGIYMLENYKFMSRIESKVTLANQLIQDFDEILTNGAGQIVRQGNKMLKIKNGLAAEKELVQYTIDSLLYGKYKKEEGILGTKAGLDKDEKIKQREIKTAIYGLDIALENEQITQEDYLKRKQAYEDQLSELGGRNVSGARIGDYLIRLTQLKAMAYNPFTATANLSFGFLTNSIHASGGEDFTPRELAKAFTIMLESSKKMASMGAWTTGTATKIATIMDNFGVVGEVVDAQYGGGEIRKKTIYKALSPYSWLRTGDFFNKGMTTVASMIHTKLENGMNLWEAFDDNGNLNPEALSAEEKEKWLGSLEVDTEAIKYKKFKNKVVELNKILHGNFDPNSPVLMKKTVLGRLVGQFKLSWISTGLEARFGKEIYNEALGRKVKGRYRTYQTIGEQRNLLSSLGFVAKNLVTKTVMGKVDTSTLTQVDAANFKRNLTELQWALAMAIAIVSLKALKDDEDEDEGIMVLINQMIRIEQDIYFYSSPNTMFTITGNVIPAFSVVGDAYKAIGGAYKYIFDEDYEGELAFKRFTKAFPITNLYNKLDYQTKQMRQ